MKLQGNKKDPPLEKLAGLYKKREYERILFIMIEMNFWVFFWMIEIFCVIVSINFV